MLESCARAGIDENDMRSDTRVAYIRSCSDACNFDAAIDHKTAADTAELGVLLKGAAAVGCARANPRTVQSVYRMYPHVALVSCPSASQRRTLSANVTRSPKYSHAVSPYQ